MGLYIKVDGTEEQINPEDGKVYDLKELQSYVGNSSNRSFIEFITLKGNKLMVIDENRYSREQSLNKKASYLAGIVIVGDVIIIDDHEFIE